VTVGSNGQKVITVDELGGIFTPIPGTPIRIAYSFGHPDAKAKTPMFTCPISAIPMAVFDLLALWNECRLLRVLPVAGGLLDQPQIVRKAFPIFANEWATVESANGQNSTLAASGAAAAAVLKAAFGGGRK
jgi:hypothetical protein